MPPRDLNPLAQSIRLVSRQTLTAKRTSLAHVERRHDEGVATVATFTEGPAAGVLSLQEPPGYAPALFDAHISCPSAIKSEHADHAHRRDDLMECAQIVGGLRDDTKQRIDRGVGNFIRRRFHPCSRSSHDAHRCVYFPRERCNRS